MKKLIFFIAQFLIVAGLFVWFYKHPGSIEINWLDYKIQMSVVVFLGLLLIGISLSFLIVKVIMLFLRFPKRLSGKYRLHRLRQAQESLKALITKYRNKEFDAAASDLKVLLQEEEMHFIGHYFAAKIAKSQHKPMIQEQHLQHIINLSGGEALGYTELMQLKIQQNEPIELLKCAKQAVSFVQKAPELAKLIFQVYLQNNLIVDAEDLLNQFKRKKILSQGDKAILESDLESAQAQVALEKKDTAVALKKSEKAYNLYPTYEKLKVYVELLLSQDQKKRVQKILEQAWHQRPDARLVYLYKETQKEALPSLQFQGIEKLTQGSPDHPESLLAKAQAALDAQLWGMALDHLQDYERKYSLTRRFLRLRAKYAQLASHDQTAALNWLEKEEELLLMHEVTNKTLPLS
ncbi:MAG: heme biosynthesis HemY N-terminal domain-containing protein [Janthinobacterium lividum]